MDSIDERIPVAGSTVHIAVVYLTRNYPAEGGLIDLATVVELATHHCDLILARIKYL